MSSSTKLGMNVVMVKLSDYGISQFVATQGARGLVGTPGFMAPEILKYHGREVGVTIDNMQCCVNVFVLLPSLPLPPSLPPSLLPSLPPSLLPTLPPSLCPYLQAYSKEVDIFSFGMFIYELVTLRIPYDTLTAQQANQANESGARPALTKQVCVDADLKFASILLPKAVCKLE